MKTLKKLSIIVAVGLSTVFFSGCSDYLDVSDDLAAEPYSVRLLPDLL